MQLVDLLRVTKWSVQGSNLRPPVSVALPYSSKTALSKGGSSQNSPSLPRISGEVPAPKDNATTVCVPHAIDRLSLRLQLLVPGLLCGVILLSGCESSRPIDGKKEPCVGLNGGQDSTLVYEYSARNIAVGLIFVELIAPPIVVALDELQCPKRRKP